MLIQLLGNSVKFTLSGSIKVTAESTQRDQIKVSVIDSGIGMSREE